MSLYIEEKNQTLLWNLINKNPLFSKIFIISSQKTEWFKTIISQIYFTLPQKISTEMLLIKNKETLSIMINDLKTREKTPTEPVYSHNQYEPSSIINQYEERQKEYELMMKKPVIKEISFKEDTDDGVIKNMDELIQNQLRERELDLEHISKTYENKQTILNIKEPITKNELIIETIDEPKENKKVSWGNDSVIEYNFILEKKIDDLNTKYNDLLKYLEKKLPNFITEFTDRNQTNNETIL